MVTEQHTDEWGYGYDVYRGLCADPLAALALVEECADIRTTGVTEFVLNEETGVVEVMFSGTRPDGSRYRYVDEEYRVQEVEVRA